MGLEYVIGIDLHGTLLDKNWKIKKDKRKKLIKNIKDVKDFCKVYVCSGNDLSFIPKYIPSDVRQEFDGYVLETGCVVSDGKKEKIIIPKKLTKEIKKLESELKKKKPKEVKYFARRLITISMFTKDEKSGIDPAKLYLEIKKIVEDLGYRKTVLVTHSDVAIDIIPKGYNKYSGIKHVAKKRKTIGIADSLNDLELILNSDYGFIPANASPKLISKIKNKNVIQSKHGYTDGVIDILRYIDKNLR